MDNKEIFRYCKKIGCCDACSLRYLGIRNPNSYEKLKEFVVRFQDQPENGSTSSDTPSSDATLSSEAAQSHSNGTSGSPPMKRRRREGCVSCLGILQEDIWDECVTKVKEVLEKKQYDCTTFACALSSPIATILREKAVLLHIQDAFKDYDPKVVTPLKEAWKWSFGSQLARLIGLALDSGAVAPLLVTITIDYSDDAQELEVLKLLSPKLFESRNRQKRRFAVEFTRRSAEDALQDCSLAALAALDGWAGVPRVSGGLGCVSVGCVRQPLYLGGRYIKLSRSLPQTPWVVGGKRMMESSVQEVIFGPIARAYGWSEAEAEPRLKLMSAGREDVDVRCLGDGRPFAIELTDPSRELTAEQLRHICEEISASGTVEVRELVHVTREALAELKKGEETKSKTYEALCIKLTHSDYDTCPPESTPRVTPEDIRRLNALSAEGVTVQQRTPIRVLHRRPLLTRERRIMTVEAHMIPEHPQLFILQLQTSAGAYVKEAIHGELGRTKPALGDAIGAQLDILALDVAKVHLDWPR